RARAQIIGPSTSLAMEFTHAKSPWLVIGKPASMTSTPRRANACAISSFCAVLSATPGLCSPSLSVVSKKRTYPTFLPLFLPDERHHLAQAAPNLSHLGLGGVMAAGLERRLTDLVLEQERPGERS